MNILGIFLVIASIAKSLPAHIEASEGETHRAGLVYTTRSDC